MWLENLFHVFPSLMQYFVGRNIEDGFSTRVNQTSVSPHEVLHDLALRQQDHVCLRVQMLEGHQIQELGLGRVVHHDLRQAQNALLEADVFEAAAAAPLELDASLVQLRG
ncbi:hypothetical protein ACLOJK_005969 [Asimina triloba]